ncbi:hypothetical protein K378_00205 [Streptomyces sp. Amel2xB2]|uniref:Trypsin-co-occurring domain-containing protein n=1 Tax=Streptomyces nanshensis TaxID=518642 RepID=A0A1E7L644_9ACTN|nr:MULTISPECIES: CU044_2847 family protein [Streptomyces]OEV11571.1 hypothetical protein AN218_12300 [Streptomyces nanshensis]RAJ71387.1 hypothetical protein K378_00205 [Streptomyces sp. Amel2xB2]
MERGIQEIELPGGERVLASVRLPDSGRLPGGAGAHEESEWEDTGAPERLSARIDQLNELIGGVGSTVLNAARSARPDEVSATFGIELMAKPGKAVAMLADGEVKGVISVTLTWKRPAPAAEEQP